jgi:hypothetical protein
MLSEDGGEVVLTFDYGRREVPGAAVYLQMLLLGAELHPYPGMEERSPIAATSWQKAE